MKSVRTWFVLIGAPFLSGCMATAMTVSSSEENQVFIGTRTNVEILSDMASGRSGSLLDMRWTWPLFVLDLPLSLTADVLFLPYTATHSLLKPPVR